MLKFLLEKEFKLILRNPIILRMLVILPLMMMMIFPWAANQDVRNVKLCVFDNDKSSYSNRLVHKLTSSGYFQLTSLAASYDEAMKSVEYGDADIILEIDNKFERHLITEGTTHVMISANAVNSMKGSLGSSYLVQILQDFTTELREEVIGVMPQNTSKVIPLIEIVPQYRYNPHLDYKIFMVPALMVILLTLITGFLPAMNIVEEKELGTIEQMNVSPVGKAQFILAKLIPYWIISFIVLTVCIILAYLVYGLRPEGSLLTLYFFTSIYIILMSGLGLVISNYSYTMQQSMFVSFFFIMVFILTSGLFTPVASMPDWAQGVAMLNPLKYFIEVMRMVFLKGSSVTQLFSQLVALLIFALIFNIWAILSYKKSN